MCLHFRAEHTRYEAFYDKIEVRPKFSEAPHLRSSIPHPKIDFSKTQFASQRIVPLLPESTKKKSEIKIGIPATSCRGTSSFRNKIAEMCYLYHGRMGDIYGYVWWFDSLCIPDGWKSMNSPRIIKVSSVVSRLLFYSLSVFSSPLSYTD